MLPFITDRMIFISQWQKTVVISQCNAFTAQDAAATIDTEATALRLITTRRILLYDISYFLHC